MSQITGWIGSFSVSMVSVTRKWSRIPGHSPWTGRVEISWALCGFYRRTWSSNFVSEGALVWFRVKLHCSPRYVSSVYTFSVCVSVSSVTHLPRDWLLCTTYPRSCPTALTCIGTASVSCGTKFFQNHRTAVLLGIVYFPMGIRNIDIDLHQGSDAAPTAFSASAKDSNG
ncbi:hypothetical protein BJV78DRAFT_380333 [Lactifluus subvellereus]|nr:hypothetical protein BJV78DRAFT_380333 [Lactifluus subvellereus]